MSEITTSCVSVYTSCQAVEQGLEALQGRGFDLRRVSLVGQGYHSTEHPIGFYKVGSAGDGSRFWGHQAAFWEGIWGRLPGVGFFWVPGFGTLVASGPIVIRLVKGFEGLALDGGFGVLGAALYNMGVPRNVIMQYEIDVKAKSFLLIIDGKRRDVERACAILHRQDQQVAVHTAHQFEMINSENK